MEPAKRFTGRAADYEKYRTRYPAQAIALLREHCGLRPEDLVADVGAGTGMVAELFLENGNEVIAVEPNADMRAVCERLPAKYDRLRIVDAAAEATGLGDASIDMVAVGRAFQWFDRERALAEFKRILKPNGWLVLLTSRRATDGSELAREYEAILMEHGTDYAKVRGGYRLFEDLKLFENVETFDVTIPGEQWLTLEEFLGQTQSYSVTPLPGDAKYEGMQRALREFFAKWSVDGVLGLETVCQVVGWRMP